MELLQNSVPGGWRAQRFCEQALDGLVRSSLVLCKGPRSACAFAMTAWNYSDPVPSP